MKLLKYIFLNLLIIFVIVFLFSCQKGKQRKMEVTKEITEITTSEKKVTTHKIQQEKPLELKAEIWPNPSNLGKVRLSVENLPNAPLFIQIFNDRDELIQEGVINGSYGASLHHTRSLPDTSGTYSIKLSDTNKVIQNLELEIL